MEKDIKKEELTLNDKIKFDDRGGAILGILEGPVADCIHPTRNGRHYGKQLWTNVLKDPLVQEKFRTGGIVGELDHPVDREEICTEKVAVIMREPPVEKDGEYIGRFDILNTPCGKIVYTLAKAGFKLGVSSRGVGEVDDYTDEVDPDSYEFTCFDVVLLPAVESARMNLITEGLDTKKNGKKVNVKSLLKESLDSSSEDDQKIMKETLDHLNINLEDDEKLENKDLKLTESDDKQKCCICGKEINGYGNNAQPVADGTCCDKCNQEVVIPARLKEMGLLEGKEEDTTENEIELKVDDEVLEPQENIEIEQPEVTEPEVIETEENVIDDETILNLLHSFLEKEGFELEGEGSEEEDFISLFHELIPNECIKCDKDICTDTKEDDKIDIVEPPAVDDIKDDEETELLENFEKVIKENIKLNEDLKTLQSEKAVSSAKVQSLKEELETFKSISANAGKKLLELKELESQKDKLTEDVKSLTEKLETYEKGNKLYESRIKSLIEGKEKLLKEQETKLNESLSSQKNTSNKQLKEALEKLQSTQKLVEKYKKLAHDIANKYIESKAISLGVTPNEIKNRLDESYTLSDVDKVCEDLQEYTLNISRLPFNFDKPGSTRVRIREDKSRDPLKRISENYDDQIDDYTIDLAERFTGMKK